MSYIHQQVGWMRCIACSDAPMGRKGQMYLLNGTYIPCPECAGRGEVARYKVLDMRTGREIDYEGQNAR